MILRRVVELNSDIQKQKQDRYSLLKERGHFDPKVIHISQEIDEKILMLQEIYKRF